MAQSKTIKDQSASAKRAATSIKNIIHQLDWEISQNYAETITRAERETLIKSASILLKIGSIKSKVAKSAKLDEDLKFKAIKSNEAEASNIISNWKVTETNLDKVALVIGARLGYSLERYLKDGPTLLNREVTSKDWSEALDDLVKEAIRTIPADAAYHAVTKNMPIKEVMSAAEENLQPIKTNPKTLYLAKEWAAKINP